MIIDTHCHLDAHYYAEGTDAVLERARALGVHAFIAIGVGDTLDPAKRCIEFAERYSDVFATVGIHPHDASTLNNDAMREIEVLVKHPRVVAVGEIGLDYHYMHSDAETQRHCFAVMIDLARRIQKPIVVHTREAAADTLAILESEKASDVGGVIHCFSEDMQFAQRALNLNFDISFSGIVTFKNAKPIQEVAAWAPSDRILLETDSPYLAPIPLRGKRCEPSYIVHTAQKVAALRNTSLEELSRQCSENSVKRFNLRECR